MRALEGGYAEVARTIHGHPTLSEAVMEAGTGRRRLADPRLRNWTRADRRGPAARARVLDAPTASTAAFYFDLASPLAYLAAERMLHVFSDAPAPPSSGARCSHAS